MALGPGREGTGRAACSVVVVTVRIDYGSCVGAMVCQVTAPDVFHDDGVRTVVIDDEADERAELASALCPVGAIEMAGAIP